MTPPPPRRSEQAPRQRRHNRASTERREQHPAARTPSVARIAGIIDRIRDIPRGHVQTYGDIEPGAPRLVGRVLATTRERNVPWYRVVRADGSIPKGDKQRALLMKEGVPMRGDRVDLGRARA